MKKWVFLASLVVLLAFPLASFAAMGEMSPKSKDIEIEFFGSLKTYPTFMTDVDFNGDVTSKREYIGDENGKMADHSIRNELRIGWVGRGENWDFLITLEDDFNLNKNNVDRTTSNFGIEKLNLRYNFGPLALKTGWLSRDLDMNTGGLVYGDDHPYVGFEGKVGEDFSWEALYIIIQDDLDETGSAGTPFDADSLDWRTYTLKGIWKLGDMNVSPFYALSDNGRGADYKTDTLDARVHYIGAEVYGKMGMFVPRFEIVYATGDTADDDTGQDYDISAYAAFASVEINVSKQFIPYFGITYETGDDNAGDHDIDAFNGITNISRYTPTFGMENSLIYRAVPSLGTALYSNDFSNLPKQLKADSVIAGDINPGYGGISNTGSGDSPGLIAYGVGAKGVFGNLFYKAQLIYMEFEEAEGLEQLVGREIDDEMGIQLDLLLTYKLNNHFSVGNCFSAFDPGDAIEDLWGQGYDDTAFLDTVELKWVW